jgi:Periplasmic binding protein
VPRHSIRRTGWALTLAVALAASVLAVAGPAAGAQGSGTEKPQDTEIGVSPDETRIAVVADVENAAAPGLFQGSVDGVKGFAKFMNAHGGLAGRKVAVDFIDSKLSADEARNAVIKACAEDFAMVGTSALFLNNVDDQLGCVDKAGAATGLPDLPFVTTETAQQCSPDTFPVAPPQLICSTKDQHPQTYQQNVGRAFYYKQKYGKNLHGVYVFGSDLKAARNSSFASLGQVRNVCCKSDKDFDISGRAPQSEYTPVVQAMKDDGSNYGQSTGAFNQMVALRKEAKLQGVNDVKVWDCGTQCYDKNFLDQGGADVEGQFVDTLYLPFLDAKERKANKMLANFVKYTGSEPAGGLGAVYAWSAAIAFRDAVNAIVKDGGVNALTRKALFDKINAIHTFDADGMFGRIDLAGRKASPCHVILQVKNGKFVRVFPKKPGTFDCNARNVTQTKLDLLS